MTIRHADQPHVLPLWIRTVGVCLVSVVAVTLLTGVVGRPTARPLMAWGTLLASVFGCVWWIRRAPDRRVVWQQERRWWVAVVALPIVFIVLLWPRLSGDGLNGDGTEAFEIARSAGVYALPHWEIEAPGHPARFGVHIAVPYFTGAALAQLPMALTGPVPLSVRLLMPVALAWCVLLVVAAVPKWSTLARLHLTVSVATFVVWAVTWVSYDSPFDVSEPAGTNMVTLLFFLVGCWEARLGSRMLAGALWSGALMTTVGAPVLLASALPALVWLDPERARGAVRWTVGLGAAWAAGLVLTGLVTGDLSWWIEQLRGEYWRDLVGNERRVPWWPVVWRWFLLVGAAPLVIAWRWREVPLQARWLSLTALGYTCVVVVGADKSLHYLMPLPFLVWPALLTVARPRELSASLVIVAAALVGGWPSRLGPDTTPQALGHVSCVHGLDFETATVGSGPIEDALASPRHPDRLGVSRHAWLWHARQGTDGPCVLGLARDLPPDAVLLARGEHAVSWARDLDAFVAWRFHPAQWTTAWWFPRDPMIEYPTDPTRWPAVIDLRAAPGEGLVIASSATNEHRLLVPAGGSGTWTVTLESADGTTRTESTVVVAPAGAWAVVPVPDGFTPVQLRRE